MTLLSRRRKTTKRSSRRHLRRSTRRRKSPIQRSRRRSGRRKLILDGTNDDQEEVRFFKNLLANDSRLVINRLVTPSTRMFFTEFFEKFQSVSVTIDSSRIIKSKFQEHYNPITNHIDNRIRETIMKQMHHTYTYVTHVQRPITIQISTGDDVHDDIRNYIKMMVFWLKVVTQYTNEYVCHSRPLLINIMLSNLKKVLPSPTCSSDDCEIQKPMVNTGFSDKCSNIVIYRKEEWFKVFVHETIHNYTLDFALNANSNSTREIRKYFGINKNIEVRLFEAYTESLARLMNALLMAYDHETTNLKRFIQLAETNIQLERLNGYFQTCKILNYLNIDLDGMQNYDEETSNLSYYIICGILYSDYQDYIEWLYKHNVPGRILQFDNDNTDEKQDQFVSFIKEKYKSDSYKRNLSEFKKLFSKTQPHTYLNTYMKKSLLTRRLKKEY
jgi:hypothetical protein